MSAAPPLTLLMLTKRCRTNVNAMAANLTSQVRAFAQISAAATDGDFTKFITVEVGPPTHSVRAELTCRC